MRITTIMRAACAVMLGLAASVSVAQSTYPERPIRLVSPFPPGGGTDYISRLLSNKLTENTQWTIAVDNRPGANGTIGLVDAARSKPTGYDLVVGQRDNMIIAPWLQKVSFDPLKSFEPVAFMASTALVIVSAADGKYQTFKEVVDAAKANPGFVTMGSSGSGSASHIASEILRTRAGVTFQHVPYKGSAPALVDVVGGQIDIAGTSIASASSLVESGKLRALAVMGEQRSSSLPDVPTLRELGFDNVEMGSWFGVLGPAGLPADIKQKLHEEINKVIQQPDVIKLLRAQGLEPQTMSVQEFADFIAKDHKDTQAIIDETGVTIN